jgi:SAM-dependent methyltransferase
MWLIDAVFKPMTRKNPNRAHKALALIRRLRLQRRNGAVCMQNSGVRQASTRVADYFSARALDYQSRSSRFPWTWARWREANAVRSLVGDVAGADVLELGAGAGFYTRELLRCGARHVFAVDISAAMLASLPRGAITAVHGDAATVRLDRRFPVLISAGMLEFVPDPLAVLANAAHHAEVAARFVVLVPRSNVAGYIYRWFHQSHGFRIHLFDRTWFETAAPRTGWSISTAVRVLPFSLAVRLRRT